jgi:hypothetical protein
MEQENVAFVSELKEDEHVIRHVEIDAGGIFIVTYNLLPTYPLYLKRWVGFFWHVFTVPLLILVLKLLPHLPSPCKKMGGAF